MKKSICKLLIFTVGITGLGGCSFLSSIFGEEEVQPEKIEARDYATKVKQNTVYAYDGKVFAVFEDKSEKEVTDKCTYSTLDTSKEGNYNVDIRYETTKYIFKTTISLEVAAPEKIKVSKIEATDYTTEIDKGSAYTFDGKVTATYEDATTKDVTSSCVIGTISTSSAGNKSFTIKYTESDVTVKCVCTVTVISRLQSITLPSTAEVRQGKSKTLTPTFNPTDATNKGLIWSSSNNSVVSVNNGVIEGVASTGSAVITATSQENSSITASTTVTIDESTLDKWTILIYMCGSNLESQDSDASTDITEILNVPDQPDNVNIVIETGGSDSWHLASSKIEGATKVPSNQLARWHVRNQKLVWDENVTESCMGNRSTYQSFLQYGIDNYPAQKTGVILWNHGGGIDGVCFDDHHTSGTDSEYYSLLASETHAAHQAVLGSEKLEFIGYDACTMGTFEIADFNSDNFNYQVTSQELEEGGGWYYTGWIDNLYNDDETETILSQICDTFVSYYSSGSNDQTLAVLDLSYASSFRSYFESYAFALKSKLQSGSISKSTFINYVKSNVKLFGDSSAYGYGQFDVKDFITKCQNKSDYSVTSTTATNVTNLLNNYVKHNKTGTRAGNSNGISLTYCIANSVDYPSSETNFTNWSSFNSSFGY